LLLAVLHLKPISALHPDKDPKAGGRPHPRTSPKFGASQDKFGAA